ncbi:MAG: hypothetical protein JSS69_08645 [Acidobacteria bacterium]|nr:hypothetical protein [Acidobacteriota bacterium]MBS1865973.1 hypothetical protein [Acidobacteriota bacterium]
MRSLQNSFYSLLLALALLPWIASGQSTSPPKGKGEWKPVPFAIVHFNEDAPKSWNLYFCSKKGVLLLRLWKRYLLIDRNAQQVFDVDPEKIVVKGEGIEFSFEDNPSEPADITDWRERDIGSLHRLRFRFGEKGSYLDIQTPLKPNGTPLY